jgi:hypothetical protein
MTQTKTASGKTWPSIPLLLLFFLLAAASSYSQQGPESSSATPQEAAPADPSDEQGVHKPRHHRVAHPAEFQGSGTLQVEFGYDSHFRSKELLSDQAGTTTISFAITDWLQAQFDLDNYSWQTDRARNQSFGVGDSHAGFQAVMFEETKRHPSLAFAYLLKLPFASEAEGLGTGRRDHKIAGLTSRKVGATEIDFTAALLVNGRERQNGWIIGNQIAAGFSHPLPYGFGIEGEVSRQSLDTDQPKGAFALGALAYQASQRIALSAGMHLGLTADSPRFGIFASVNIGVAIFSKKRQ